MPAPRKKRSPSFPARPPVQGKPKAPTTSADNLEMAGDRLKVYSLQTLLTNKRSPETRATARLGDVLLPWYEQVVAKPAEKLGPLIQLWQSLAPSNLVSRSRILGFSRGTLTVALDSSTVRAEMEACLRGGLLRHLQSSSRGTIFKVKTCVQFLAP